MTERQPGYYPDESGITRWWDGEQWAGAPDSRAVTDHTQWAESQPSPHAVAAQTSADERARRPKGPEFKVLQVVLKEQLFGAASANLADLEEIINRQSRQGWRLHSMSTTTSGTHGIGGGDRIQATLVFEKLVRQDDDGLRALVEKLVDALATVPRLDPAVSQAS